MPNKYRHKSPRKRICERCQNTGWYTYTTRLNETYKLRCPEADCIKHDGRMSYNKRRST